MHYNYLHIYAQCHACTRVNGPTYMHTYMHRGVPGLISDFDTPEFVNGPVLCIIISEPRGHRCLVVRGPRVPAPRLRAHVLRDLDIGIDRSREGEDDISGIEWKRVREISAAI